MTVIFFLFLLCSGGQWTKAVHTDGPHVLFDTDRASPAQRIEETMMIALHKLEFLAVTRMHTRGTAAMSDTFNFHIKTQ